MKTIRFYFDQFAKRCGYLNCDRKGYFLLPTREGMTGFRFTVWVSCGHKHTQAVR